MVEGGAGDSPMGRTEEALSLLSSVDEQVVSPSHTFACREAGGSEREHTNIKT